MAYHNLNTLKEHREAKHLGIRHPCDKCDFVATRAKSLVRHKKSKHRDNLQLYKEEEQRMAERMAMYNSIVR